MSANDRSGALAAAAWSAAIASRSDPARYRRGKEYLRENAVIGLEVSLGHIEGEVVGSRPEPYRARITLPNATIESGPAPVPAASALQFSCSCPDWDEPCKHAVAVALAFAERIRMTPELLIEATGARSLPPGSIPTTRARAGGAAVPERHLRLVTSAPQPEPLPPEIASFLGMPPGAPPAVRPDLVQLTVGSFSVGQVEIGELVADAMHWLSVLHR